MNIECFIIPLFKKLLFYPLVFGDFCGCFYPFLKIIIIIMNHPSTVQLSERFLMSTYCFEFTYLVLTCGHIERTLIQTRTASTPNMQLCSISRREFFSQFNTFFFLQIL